MRPGYGMFQQQAAKMHLTPQLQQAIKLLQMPTPQLLEMIRQELDENPVLESPGTVWDSYAPYRTAKRRMGVQDHDDDPLHQIAGNDISLERQLREQLAFTKDIPQPVQRIARYMIGNLDSNGYLAASLDEIAKALRAAPVHVERALSILQSFEPPGVGARNLRECLLLQIRHLPECPPLVPLLIESYLEDIADLQVSKISGMLQASPQQIEAAIHMIKQLNPRPGAAYHQEEIQYIIPDVIIEKAGERFAVSVSETAAPRLFINGYYERMAKECRDTGEAGQFLIQRLHSAKFLIKCMERRRWTLFRVTRAIVEEQIPFFQEGISSLRPMTLKQIADKVGLHESTVSRATAGKYAQTPWGLFELKQFFPSGVRTNRGDAVSTDSVKAIIKGRISGENRRKPYSDQQLADFLSERDIPVSRRTVTKYREELGIPSSVRRKR